MAFQIVFETLPAQIVVLVVRLLVSWFQLLLTRHHLESLKENRLSIQRFLLDAVMSDGRKLHLRFKFLTSPKLMFDV